MSSLEGEYLLNLSMSFSTSFSKGIGWEASLSPSSLVELQDLTLGQTCPLELTVI